MEMVAKEIPAEPQRLLLSESFPFLVPDPTLTSNQHHSPLIYQVHLHTEVKNHALGRFRGRKECMYKPGGGTGSHIHRGKLCAGEGCTRALAISSCCWMASHTKASASLSRPILVLAGDGWQITRKPGRSGE